VRACYRGSVGASLGVTATTALHRALGTWRDRVDVYVTPSQFLSSKFIAAGFSPHRIVVKPNFVHPDPGAGRGEGGFVLFVGRLSPEKGVGTLLRAWSMVGTAIQLRIVGDGPLARDVVKASRSVRIEWLGRKPSDEVLELMGQARFVVIPSEWYENFPLVLVEAWSKATPIIASNVGATADLVTDRVTGFHFRAGDAEDLARVVRSACAEGRDGSAMRRRVREHYESHYSGEANYRMLTRIYTKALTDRARENRALEAFGRPSETRR
jgi:glycosyltransferase involved in cell wall biosynthesis